MPLRARARRELVLSEQTSLSVAFHGVTDMNQRVKVVRLRDENEWKFGTVVCDTPTHTLVAFTLPAVVIRGKARGNQHRTVEAWYPCEDLEPCER